MSKFIRMASHEETEHPDFISRIEFTNRTGIIVTPGYYHIVYDSFKKSGKTVDDFIDSYETGHIDVVSQTDDQIKLKYHEADCELSLVDTSFVDESFCPNVYEIINNLLQECRYQKLSYDEMSRRYEELIERYNEVIERLINMTQETVEVDNSQNFPVQDRRTSYIHAKNTQTLNELKITVEYNDRNRSV